MAKKIIINTTDNDTFKRIEGLTKSPEDVERLKEQFYIDTIESVMWKRYQIANTPVYVDTDSIKVASCTFDAFAQNCFYIADLVEFGLINDENADRLNMLNIELFHKENNKKRGDNNGRH